ncbi:MAG: c-type cytochrome, partial [Chthoniobacteraceae bacterium]|nr:c-type cytochrome [Chthoniobacteraceae bacterium]
MRWQILGIYLILFSGNICSPVLSALSPELPPLFQEFCFDCHGDGSKKGGVSFDHTAFNSPEEQRKFWFDVWRNLDAELMPPSDKPRPTPEQRAALQAWVESTPLHL